DTPPEDYFNDHESTLARIEPAWAKAALHFRTGEQFGHTSGRLLQSLQRVHDQLDVFRKRSAGGNSLALLHAVAICSHENLPLPTWLALAFGEALRSFVGIDGKAASLDAAFIDPDNPTSTAKKAAIMRQNWQMGATLWRAMWSLILKDKALKSFDAALVATLQTKPFGVAKSKARYLILMIEKNQLEFLDSKQSISRFLANRRKQIT
ncbi:MAG: hypothetical protein ABIN37_09115, partial [Burkholderiaceae bacterium]